MDFYARRIRTLWSQNCKESVSRRIHHLLARYRHPALLPNSHELYLPSLQGLSAPNLDSTFLCILPAIHTALIGDVDDTTAMFAANLLHALSISAPGSFLVGLWTRIY